MESITGWPQAITAIGVAWAIAFAFVGFWWIITRND